ncbi:MAG: nucleotide-binding universal stress UspA family protein [Cyclobacteriaceae bacterium]|jgi:nucleotide-binding universal stress UspA family protein
MRTFNKILIATDFSPAAWSSVKMGLGFSKSQQICISLLHVYPSNAAIGRMKDADRDNFNDLDREMRKFCAELEETVDACIKPVLLSGNVNDQILDYIKKEPHDLIIIGINSNGSNNDAGSHTIEIIKSSGVPVLVIPNSLGS